MSHVVTRLIAASAVAALVAWAPAGAAQDKASTVSVTVKYTGKGTVDAKHKLWVWVFDTPDIGAGSAPVGEQAIEKNGGTATFQNISAQQVYIAVAYDEAGGFAGQAPPPPGSPIALYGAKTEKDKPQPVTPGPKGRVTITFDDSARM